MQMVSNSLDEEFASGLTRIEQARYKNLMGSAAFATAAAQAALIVDGHLANDLERTLPTPEADVKADVVKLFGEAIKPAQCRMTPPVKAAIRELFGALVTRFEIVYQEYLKVVNGKPNRFLNKKSIAERARTEVQHILWWAMNEATKLQLGTEQFKFAPTEEAVTAIMVQNVLDVAKDYHDHVGWFYADIFDNEGQPLVKGFDPALWSDELFVLRAFHELKTHHGIEVKISRNLPIAVEGELPMQLDIKRQAK